MKLSDYIAIRLKQHYKVEHFFMVSGGGAMHLNDSLGRQIPYTCNHNEQASSMAAEGYARAGQKLAVVNVTTGPGGLNSLNGVFGQWTDSVPVLYISGQVKFSTTIAACPDIQLRQLGDQEVDIINVVKPLVKYAKMVTEPDEIKFHLDKAIYEATTGRYGPVWLDIPMNVQGAEINENELKGFTPPPPATYDLKVEEVITALKDAKRPILIAGHGIRLSGQEQVFYELIKKISVPVVTTFNSFDIIPDTTPNYVGRIGTVGNRAGNFALQNADLILCMGTRNNIRQASYNYENFAKDAFKIVVDIDQAELDKPTVIPDLKIHADLKIFLPAILEHSGKIERPEWLAWCKTRQERYGVANTPEYAQSKSTINPYYFTRKLTEQMGKQDIMVMGNGSACVCPFQTATVKKGQRFILNSGDASMGFALPASVGAALSTEGRRVICLTGDGSIMMNIQELQTIKHNNIPVKIFIINNNGYISIQQTHKGFFNGHLTGCNSDSGVSMPDFIKVAEAFGITAMRIDKPDELEAAIAKVLAHNGPVICDVIVDNNYSFAPKLSARRLEDGTIVSPCLDDMSPFLSREELETNRYR